MGVGGGWSWHGTYTALAEILYYPTLALIYSM
jgi:hypothetical protein